MALEVTGPALIVPNAMCTCVSVPLSDLPEIFGNLLNKSSLDKPPGLPADRAFLLIQMTVIENAWEETRHAVVLSGGSGVGQEKNRDPLDAFALARSKL